MRVGHHRTSPRTRSATSSTSRCPRSATEVEAGAAVGELESTKSVSDVYAPVSGEVVARNEALDATPELVNTDPYGDGWLFEVVPSDASAVDGLMDAAAYQASLVTEPTSGNRGVRGCSQPLP